MTTVLWARIRRLIYSDPTRRVRKPRQPGSAKGKLVILADDNEHLKDFREYMP